MNWIIALVLVVIFELVADVLAKEWSLKQTLSLAVATFLIYMASNAFWLFALKAGSGLARGLVLFSVASAVIGTIVGVLWYHESLSPLQLAGVVLGITAIVLISWGSQV